MGIPKDQIEGLEQVAGALRVSGMDIQLEPVETGNSRFGRWVDRARNGGRILYELRGSPRALEAMRASAYHVERFQQRLVNAKVVTADIIDKTNEARLVTGGIIHIVNGIRQGSIPSLFDKNSVE